MLRDIALVHHEVDLAPLWAYNPATAMRRRLGHPPGQLLGPMKRNTLASVEPSCQQSGIPESAIDSTQMSSLITSRRQHIRNELDNSLAFNNNLFAGHRLAKECRRSGRVDDEERGICIRVTDVAGDTHRREVICKACEDKCEKTALRTIAASIRLLHALPTFASSDSASYNAIILTEPSWAH